MILIELTSTGLILASFNYDSDENPVYTNADHISFGKTRNEVVDHFHDLFKTRSGILSSLDDLLEEQGDICTFNPLIYDMFRHSKHSIKFVSSENLSNVYFQARAEIMSQLFGTKEEYHQYNRTIAIELVKSKLRSPLTSKDLHLIQALNAVDDLTNIANLFFNRVQEWYSVHFPELISLVSSNQQLLRMVADIGSRESFSEDKLKNLNEARSTKIISKAMTSTGKDMDSSDFIPLQQLAKFALETEKTREGIYDYIERFMPDIAPNLTELLGYKLACRLLAKAGSLKNLALKPASTIQVYGAEAALFRHIKSGSDPPKHGLIFQSEYIHGAKRHLRGKIARLLAGKISIAARVDYFTGDFIAPALKEDLEKKIIELEKKPPPRKKKDAKKRKRKPKRGKRDKNRPDKQRKPSRRTRGIE
ncbi:MAG: NOP5/NOP56 family protein [Candidatus Hodarchaeales archaeon]